jgi:hypothetical protein
MNFQKKELDFSNKKLTKFPEQIFETRKLRKLSLRGNLIKMLPKEICELKYLETLDLSNNKISNVFAKLFELSNLRILILDNNQIKNIPRQIENLIKLKILSISKNSLNRLPPEIKKLKQLQELNISSNLFETFPTEIFYLNQLKSLYISRNKFKDFPVGDLKDKLSNLQRLYCYSNALEDGNNINSTFLEFSRRKGNSISYLRDNEPELISPSTDSEELNNAKNAVDLKQRKNKIFVSYSHQDSEWLDRIKVHLKSLNNEGILIDLWDDTRIKAGQKWKDEIKIALEEAYIAILIVSADFLASDFIIENELPPLLKNAAECGTKIIPVIANPCRFTKNKQLSQFQSINDPTTEILSNLSKSKQEAIYVRLTNDIESYVLN